MAAGSSFVFFLSASAAGAEGCGLTSSSFKAAAAATAGTVRAAASSSGGGGVFTTVAVAGGGAVSGAASTFSVLSTTAASDDAAAVVEALLLGAIRFRVFAFSAMPACASSLAFRSFCRWRHCIKYDCGGASSLVTEAREPRPLFDCDSSPLAKERRRGTDPPSDGDQLNSRDALSCTPAKVAERVNGTLTVERREAWSCTSDDTVLRRSGNSA